MGAVRRTGTTSGTTRRITIILRLLVCPRPLEVVAEPIAAVMTNILSESSLPLIVGRVTDFRLGLFILFFLGGLRLTVLSLLLLFFLFLFTRWSELDLRLHAVLEPIVDALVHARRDNQLIEIIVVSIDRQSVDSKIIDSVVVAHDSQVAKFGAVGMSAAEKLVIVATYHYV